MSCPIKLNLLLIPFIILSGIFSSEPVFAFETDLSGQLSLWGNHTRQEDQSFSSAGIRYIPQLSMVKQLLDDSFIDAELSLNGFMTAHAREEEKHNGLDIYRAKLRFATARTETRLGLQKINFGPARLLRALKWFDQLDPSDPINLTNGVKAIRFRYDGNNNVGFWVWGLYGNDEPKGYEILSSDPYTPEFGGRLFHPVFDGELAITAHTRRVSGSPMNFPDFTENRLALDGKWDIGVGIWFETLFQHQETSTLPFVWTKLFTIGLDYTFDLGSGVYFLAEHMTMALSEKVSETDEDANISAFSLNYPVGMIDNLRTMGYYLWDLEEISLHIGWQRTYDTIVLDLSVFKYPETIENMMFLNQSTASGGTGVQIMVNYHH